MQITCLYVLHIFFNVIHPNKHCLPPPFLFFGLLIYSGSALKILYQVLKTLFPDRKTVQCKEYSRMYHSLLCSTSSNYTFLC